MVELRIKEVMKEKGIKTQRDLADKMGISYANLCSMLKRTPTLNTLEKVAEAMDVEIGDLVVKRGQRSTDRNTTTTELRCPHCGEKLYIRSLWEIL